MRNNRQPIQLGEMKRLLSGGQAFGLGTRRVGPLSGLSFCVVMTCHYRRSGPLRLTWHAKSKRMEMTSHSTEKLELGNRAEEAFLLIGCVVHRRHCLMPTWRPVAALFVLCSRRIKLSHHSQSAPGCGRRHPHTHARRRRKLVGLLHFRNIDATHTV
jgi:hypothetical protein